jgi:D-alanyl-D-alanine carboxypeptidase/D-alanyl-D-alanine-endopeptidase (penicillin-binding protein 4)
MNDGVRRGGMRAALRRSLVLLVAFLVVSGCRHARPVVVPPPSNAARIVQLQHAIDVLLADAEVSRGTWGVVVRSLTRNDTLYTANPTKLLMPASAMKIVTLAAAADRLGWDYEYRTTTLMVGTLNDGTLNGDLILVGGGEPSVVGLQGSLLDQWAEDVRAHGIRSITGRVIGDDHAFDNNELGSGWMWDDLVWGYSAPVTALQFNRNTAQIVVTPADTGGVAPTVAVNPPWAPVALRSLVMTTAPDVRASLTVRALFPSLAIELSGSVPGGSMAVTRDVAVPFPTLYFAAAARDALTRHGIEVAGPAIDIDETVPPDRGTATVLATFSSRLGANAVSMMKLSDNLRAESLLKLIGAGVAGKGSTEAGLAAVRATLTAWGVAAGDAVVADGSGLSRYNLITPRAMVDVLAHVFHDERLRDTFVNTLPVAGVDGTLENRMRDTMAQGNARAKSGSFTNARALAGTVMTRDREPLAFAIIANNYNADPRRVDNVADAIVVALAEFSR